MIRRLLLLAGALLLVGAATAPQKAVLLSPEEAEKQGRELVAELLSLRPERDSVNTGTLAVRKKGKGTEVIPVKFRTVVSSTNWVALYEAGKAESGAPVFRLRIVRGFDGSTVVGYAGMTNGLSETAGEKCLSGNGTMLPFADSDFWIADLALEFFRWPAQRLVKKEMNRSRFCKVLESINPQPAPGGYSKVRSWIDNESGGIVQAEAYDDKGTLLKQFFPKRLEKVRGQYELAEMQIYNRQTESRTTIEFEFGRE